MPYQLLMEKMHAEKVHKLLQISVLRGMICNSLWKLLEGGMERGCLWQNDHGVPGDLVNLRGGVIFVACSEAQSQGGAYGEGACCLHTCIVWL